jgi:hypothetical protein
MNDELRERLDAVEDAVGIGTSPAGGTVVYVGGVDDLPPALRLTHTPDDPTDPIDAVERPALPQHRPPGYRGGATVLGAEDVTELWKTMPDDVRDRERELRRDQDDPIPPILATDDTDAGDPDR